jgi:hypothetical protein
MIPLVTRMRGRVGDQEWSFWKAPQIDDVRDDNAAIPLLSAVWSIHLAAALPGLGAA